MNGVAVWGGPPEDTGRPQKSAASEASESGQDAPEPPAGPRALEPAESDTMRRLREAMGRNRDRT
ncbi:hypothetical protein GCM10010442_15500 [Kitasatospora kifunensis]|uniref:Uncharacterized protein n=1 Tax=Kitasatospora kifunensis TaxID=58351 RepID=A0A7W7QXD1_KITKI|nr:hypothetical protein [Kitasatospora kifunensis]